MHCAKASGMFASPASLHALLMHSCSTTGRPCDERLTWRPSCSVAFAAQACYVSRELDLDPAKVNPNGGAIALGHPVGATGAILATKAVYELQRVQGRYGLMTMCIGGGQGIAVVIESML